MQVIGIDVGRDSVKAVGIKRLKFKSLVGEWRQMKLVEGGEYQVEVDGKHYFVADLAQESYFRREMVTESKIHPETAILFFTALALVARPDQPVKIITGLPVRQHTPEIKQQLIKMLTGDHFIKVNEFGGHYSIQDIKIAPEGGAAFWNQVLDHEGRLQVSQYARDKVRVIDIGSRTVNYCTVEQRKYRDADSGSLQYGILDLYNASNDEHPSDCMKENFARRIAADLAKKWPGYKADKDMVLLAGGGSIMLEPWLQTFFPLGQCSPDAIWANAQGYRKMGMVQ